MAKLSKRSTIYFDPAIHRALKEKAATTRQSLSVLVDEAVRLLLQEDQESLVVFDDRVREPEISREDLLRTLRKHGKI